MVPKRVWFVLWITLIVFHVSVGTINILAVPVLWFTQPMVISVPLISVLALVNYNRLRCPLTDLENAIRKQLEWRTIDGFNRHYYYRPLLRFLRRIGKHPPEKYTVEYESLEAT